jgi:hypothetical protein
MLACSMRIPRVHILPTRITPVLSLPLRMTIIPTMVTLLHTRA